MKWYIWIWAWVHLVFHCRLTMSVFIVPFLRYSASKNGVTLKYGFDDVQGPWKWRCSIDHIRLSAIVISIALSCTIFELFDVEWYRDLEILVRTHSRSFESLGTVSHSPSICNYGSILYLFRDKASRKSPFLIPHMHSKKLWGWRQNITIPFGVDRKTRVATLRWKKNSSMFNRSTEYRRLTDGTDRRTDILRRYSPRYA